METLKGHQRKSARKLMLSNRWAICIENNRRRSEKLMKITSTVVANRTADLEDWSCHHTPKFKTKFVLISDALGMC